MTPNPIFLPPGIHAKFNPRYRNGYCISCQAHAKFKPSGVTSGLPSPGWRPYCQPVTSVTSAGHHNAHRNPDAFSPEPLA